MALLLVQMTTVLLVALVCGWLARKLGQAGVIGEIIGGILIGPSVFGRVAPHAWAALFPPTSLGGFEILSTVGLILFLFLIGSELDYEHLRQQKRTTAIASITHEHCGPIWDGAFLSRIRFGYALPRVRSEVPLLSSSLAYP